MNIQYSVGEKRDCVEIANWVNSVGHGHIEYLFAGLNKDVPALQHLVTILQEDEYYSFKNADLAIQNNVVIGMIFSYATELNRITIEMEQKLSADRLQWMRYFSDNQIANSWYINTIAVRESLRRQGIATRLMQLAIKRALKNGYKSLCLHVYEDNYTAIDFYERFGFFKVKRIEFGDHAFFQSKGLSANYLMEYKLHD